MGTWGLLVGPAGATQRGGAASAGLELVELVGAGGPQGGAWPEPGAQGRGAAVTFRETTWHSSRADLPSAGQG